MGPNGTGEESHHKPQNGSFVGHLLPGAFFLIWSVYWLICVCAEYLHRQRAKQEFRGKSWYPFALRPRNIEPICKVALSLLGALVELRLGHDEWRRLYKPNHHFDPSHLNNFQHALMYAGVALSGAVDLIGQRFKLPADTEKVFLSLAFLVEALLMGLHAKHHPLDAMLHILLTWVMVSTSVTCIMEVNWPNSVLVALLRPYTVFLQGTWFIQVGYLLFLDLPAWDLHDDANLMFAPVVFCLHLVLVGIVCLTVFLVMERLFERWYGHGPHSLLDVGATKRDVVLSNLDELELADVPHATESTKLLSGKESRD